MLVHGKFSRVVSTDSTIALPFLAGGRLHGASCHYIESVSTPECAFANWSHRGAPSGGLGLLPGDNLGGGWMFRGTVFDGYQVTDHPRSPSIKWP